MKRLLSTLAAAALLSGSLGLPALSDEAAGAYLAARQARYESDYAAAAEYLTQALIKDPSNPELLDFTAAAFVSLGRIDKAIPVAHRVESITAGSQIANMTLVAEMVREGDFDGVLQRVADSSAISPLADGLLAAWANLGKGDMTRALELFERVACGHERNLTSILVVFHRVRHGQ